MKRVLNRVCIILFVIFSGVAFAQTEQCNNGIDDDGDGLIDCNDPDCQYAANIERGCNCADGIDNDGDGGTDKSDADCASFYGLTFIGDGDSDCSITPDPSSGTFDFVNPSNSGQNTVDTQSKIAVGDVNCDGIPDVVTTSKWNQTIRVVATSDDQPDGSDKGDIIQSFKTPGSKIFPNGNFFFELEVLIADIDGSCPAEIFSIVSKRKNANDEPSEYFLVGFRANASPSNASLVPLFDAVSLGPDRPGQMTISDLDCDGNAEIILKDHVYDAATGTLLADGNIGDWNTEVTSAPVAIDIFEGGNLEIVMGNQILSYPDMSVIIDMNTLGGDQWFPKEIFDPNEYGFDNYSSVSVADMNGDGHLDVVLSGAEGSKNGPTAIFFWDVTNGTVSSFLPDDPVYANGWPWGTSRPNLGDIDGDGQLEITFIAGNQLFALEVDPNTGELSEKWRRTINDSRSGIVATTVFDFDNDGSPEIVYRDSQQLVVIDGETGQNVLWSSSCQSHTMTEGPIIADVDGDGATDLCTTCNTNNSFDITAPIQQQALGELRCFFSQNNTWLPTRQVWNQSGYFVTNIADDLSVPCPQFDMGTVFSDSPCANGLPGPQRPFNTFMNQVPSIGPDGCPFYPSPDVSFVGHAPGELDPLDPDYFPAVEVIPPTCGDLGVEVLFNIVNSGSLTISTQIPVSFWEGNPTVAVDPDTGNPATLLHADALNVLGLQVGDTMTTAGVTFDYSGQPTRLYIVLNDDGTEFPVDTTASSTGFAECKLDNNIYAVDIIPEPFTVEIENISDNFKCDDAAPDTGELRGVVKRNGVEVADYSPYGFQWYYGSDTTNAVPAPEGTIDRLMDLPEGTYTLVVTNLAKGCSSLPVVDTVLRQGVDPDVTILINSHQTHCSPPNGELEVTIVGGLAGFSFQWYDNNLNSIGVTGPIASDLTEGEWIVDVIKDGCTERVSQTINGPTEPDVTASVVRHITDCSALTNGKVTAQPFINAVLQDTTDYTFEWYIYNNGTGTLGSVLPPATGSGATRSGLTAGYYAVIAHEIISGCESSPPQIVQVTDQRDYPVPVINEIAPQTSCDPLQPNGILEVVINGGDSPANYTIEWFRGQNTLPANLHTSTSGVNGERAENVEGGGIPYTVKVTNATNCFSTEEYIISQDVNTPVVTLTKSDNTICDPALASSDYNGQVTASVTFKGDPITLPDPLYEFTWYDGTTTSDPVIAVTDNNNPMLSTLPGGYYTVEVTRTDLFCTSVPVTIEVLDVEDLPDVEVVITPMTTCAGTTPNGEAAASVNLGGGIFATTGYTFEWYVGNTASGTPVSVVSGSEGEIAQQLDGAFNNNEYTVLVINNSTGCSNTMTIAVPDESSLPVVSLTPQDNDICDPSRTDPSVTYNGGITASVNDQNNGGAVTDFSIYSFTWTDINTGNNVLTQVAGSSEVDNVLSNIPGGDYEVTVTNTVLGCTSDPVQVTVNDVDDLPVISVVETPNTACDATLANGSLSANIGGVTTGYSFAWYQGNFASGTLLSTSSAITGYQGNENFTVEVVNDATGCSNTLTVFLDDNSLLPILSLSGIDNTVCDPAFAGVNYDGSVTASVDDFNNGGVVSDFSNYTFTWIDVATGNNVLSQVSGSTAPAEVLSNVPGGTYEVTVTNTVLGCTSDPVRITIDNEDLLPEIDVASIPNTACDASLANGQLTATVDESPIGGVAGVTTGYTFNWYNGNAVTGTPDQSGNTYSALEGALVYTVEVINNATGCRNTVTTILPDAQELPLVTLNNSVNNTICDVSLGYNGSITVDASHFSASVLGDPDYTFTWVDPFGTTLPETSETLPGINGGTYTVTVSSANLGCTSDPLQITISDQLYLPAIDIAVTDQTYCVGSSGELEATIDETAIGGGNPADPNDYIFTWYEYDNTTNTSSSLSLGTVGGTNGELVTQLPGGYYRLEVERVSTGCINEEVVYLPELITIPVVNVNKNSDVTTCGAPNGQLTADVGGVSAGFTFYWYDGNDAINENFVIANADYTAVDDGLYAGLIPGDYTVVAVNNTTQCISPLVVTEVEDLTANIVIDINPIVFPTACDLNDGQMTAQPDNGISNDPADYTYEWYEGAPLNNNIDFFTNPPQFADLPISTAQFIGGLGTGTYTVVVTYIDDGCSELRTIFLPFIDAHEITSSVQNSAECPYTTGDGEVSFTITPPGTAPPGASFDVKFYSGANPIPANQIGGTFAGVTPGSEPFFSNLAPGYYLIEAEETYTGKNCIVYEVVEVGIDAQPPVVTLVGTVSSNTTCDLSQADGEFTVDIQQDANDVTVGTNFNIDVTPPPLIGSYPLTAQPTGVYTIQGLSPNTYTVTVTASTGCSTVREFTVPDAPAVSDIVDGDVVITAADLCDPSGSVEITSINLIGAGPDNLDNFQFSWYDDAGLTNLIFQAQGDATAANGGEVLDPDSYPDMGPGSYWVVAQKTTGAGAGCFSAPFKADVPDTHVNPTIALEAFANTSCDPGFFEGSLEITMTTSGGPGAVVPGPYTYTFSDTNGDPVFYADGVTPIGPFSGQSGSADAVTDLNDGTYVIVAENEATGCTVTGTITIPLNKQPIFVLSATPVHQNLCDPSGSVFVDGVSLNGVDPANKADFTFEWYRGDPNGAPLTDFGGIPINVDLIDASNYPSMGAGTYYVVAVRNTNAPPGAGCKSAPYRVDVKDISVDPQITLSSTVNTACDLSNPTGTIRVQMDISGVPGSSYAYRWQSYTDPNGASDPSVLPADNLTAGDDETYMDLPPGKYVLEVENNDTGCMTQGTITINDDPVIPDIVSFVPTNQTFCSPANGTITIADNDIEIDGMGIPVSELTIDLFESDQVTPAGGTKTINANDVVFSDLDFGTYYLFVTRSTGTSVTGEGCPSAPLRIDLKDISVDPALTLTSTSNTACDGNFDGSITLNFDDPSGPGVGALFDITWLSVPAGSVVADATNIPAGSYTTDITDLVGHGKYRVMILNKITGCSREGEITVTHKPQPIDLVSVTHQNQDICYPDGRIEVTVTSPVSPGNYSFEWFLDDPNSAPLTDQFGAVISGAILEPGLLAGQYPSMGAGTYYIVATRNAANAPGSGCPSPPFRVDVLDVSTDPIPTLTFLPNTACDPALANGTVTATVREQDGSTTDTYDYIWTYNGGALPGMVAQNDAGNVSTLTGAPEGTYRVTITNVSNTGCTINSSVKVTLDQPQSEPNIISVSTIDPLDCTASGSAEVTSISIGGGAPISGPSLTTDFTYEWYINDVLPANQLVGSSPSMVNLLPGQYFIIVTSNLTGCESIPKEFNILEDDIISPVITINQTVPQINCIGPPFSAELLATAEESDGNIGTYTFSWSYEGSPGLPAGGFVSNTTLTSSTVSNLPTGTYEVTAFNPGTGCSSTAFYIITDESEDYKPIVSTSSEPLTFCSGDNGSVLLANVRYPSDYPYTQNYTVDWYIGDTPNLNATPNFENTNRVSNLPDGLYTIRVTDNNTGCIVTKVQSIRDERQYPDIVIVEDNPQTTCPPYNPNGQLTATADGGRVGGYTFEWFAGTNASGAVISTRNRLIGYPMGSYTVRVTNNLTGCVSTETGSVSDGRLTPPSPTPELLANLTSCIDPNGELRVSVGGQTQGYDFNWYEGSSASGTPFSDRIVVTGLDIGTYTVTAIDVVTGCVSEGVSIEVGDERLLPEFEFETVGSKCDEETGMAMLGITNNTIVTTVVWTDATGFTVGYGTDLTGMPSGEYTAEVTTFLGCENTGTVEIGTVITNYNLVSADGDGINDNFQIDCITNFPNNNVRIYNRTGVLVFKIDGYNNVDKVFEGVGQEGMYSMGDKLPNGTYYYIIDKGDGTELISGFLELIR
ncbi:gliding motility-associated C-terminal domain-containing protein [Fulvivirga imtechensis]|nr:gliding motility-associated C-terminal domain-containing protein [Fulvivirga imtechensis]